MPDVNIDELEHRMRVAAARALNLAVQEVGARSLPRVPLEFGDLRGSGHQAEDATPESLHATWAYSTRYAAAQHEGYAVQHRAGRQVVWRARRYTTPGTGPKFLEGPLKEFIPEFESFMAAAMRPYFEATR